jgi:hypothetical protein
MTIAGVEHYDPKAASYTDLMKKAKAAGADAVSSPRSSRRTALS